MWSRQGRLQEAEAIKRPREVEATRKSIAGRPSRSAKSRPHGVCDRNQGLDDEEVIGAKSSSPCGDSSPSQMSEPECHK
ncbi:hypothetical protein BRADI_4g07566v3 [Brachypodium distachyon]|uniref:Uncharacterized protein n=1 Tax=Brachypodium distachyon TaxID=15368 RepID=A0A0Q3H0F9_BRADI|nr:hypothetical protein BRADI_4g07566v3 [Brachypodium distachyon]